MSRKIIKSKHFFEEDFTEQLAEVPVKTGKPFAENDKLKYIGKEISRTDGYDKVSGTALYSFDINLPRMIQAKTLRCPYAHARIKSIDISKAEKLSGVQAILTKDNSPEIKWYNETSKLFDETLRHEGDEVACVAAVTEKIALQALKLINVDYEILPHVVDAREALKEDSPKVHDWGNAGRPNDYSRGDVEKAWQEADAIIEDTYFTQVANHNPTEAHCSVVNWDGDKLTVYDSTQGIFGVRSTVAETLGLPEANVRIIKKYMGGGFGSKLEAGKYTIMAALLAKKTGRPVRITLDRQEMNLAVGNRPDSVQKIKAAAKNWSLETVYIITTTTRSRSGLRTTEASV